MLIGSQTTNEHQEVMQLCSKKACDWRKAGAHRRAAST